VLCWKTCDKNPCATLLSLRGALRNAVTKAQRRGVYRVGCSRKLTYVCLRSILFTMRTTIRMNNALAKEVKRYAQKADLTFTEVVERALCEWLAKKRSPTKPKAHIPLPTFGNPNK